jgi:hypothetical protein
MGLFSYCNTPEKLANAYETVCDGIMSVRGFASLKINDKSLGNIGIVMDDALRVEIEIHEDPSSKTETKVFSVEAELAHDVCKTTFSVRVSPLPLPKELQPIDPVYKAFLHEREVVEKMMLAVQTSESLAQGHQASQEIFSTAYWTGNFSAPAIQRMNNILSTLDDAIQEEEDTGEEYSQMSQALVASRMSSQRY